MLLCSTDKSSNIVRVNYRNSLVVRMPLIDEAAANSIGRAHSLSRSLTATTSESWHVVVYLAASTLRIASSLHLFISTSCASG